MFSTLFNRIANNENKKSMASKLRIKRFELFKDLIKSFGRPISILDVGGTINFWEVMGYTDSEHQITLLNLIKSPSNYKNISSVIGDATNMSEYADKHFDVVFSNSCIEHLGSYENMKLMAEEIKRVGSKYFIQTPNKYFFIEPHFCFPFYNFLPHVLQIELLTHFKLGWISKRKNRKDASDFIKAIRLLSKKELESLFPDSTLYEEKFLGLTKSFIVYTKE